MIQREYVEEGRWCCGCDDETESEKVAAERLASLIFYRYVRIF